MLSVIIDKLNESDPKIEGCSFLIREVSYKDSVKDDDKEFRAYSIRVLFSGKELSTLETYMHAFVGMFRYLVGESKKKPPFYLNMDVLKETSGQLVFPSHAGAEYKISVNITIEA
jgi:hypothetical protein